MPKAETFQDLSLTPSTRNQELWRWLYTELRAAILDGRLKPGTRLPSTRGLSAQYEVSRGTVTAAFDQLQAEGYTRTEVGSGTYVALRLPEESCPTDRLRRTSARFHARASLSKRGQEMVRNIAVLPASHLTGKAFRSYEPAIDLFPADLWARVSARVLRSAPRSLYGHGNAGGYPPLRRAIAEYVGGSRGVRCSPEQIIVTSGSQQALDLLARLLLDAGDQVWMEDPGYSGAWQTLRAAGAIIVPVPVDHDGLNIEVARKLSPQAKMAYVTPANQFPLGITMSADRRMDLLNWAATSGAWIVEDEYDAEYRYHGRPVAALQSLDRSDSVIYVGTFTKMLFNALRMGFMVIPERLMSAFEAAKSIVDRHPPTLDQAVLTEFIMEGHFGHHVRKMRHTYSERLAVLRDESEKHLTDFVELVDAAAGMRTIAWLKAKTSDNVIAQRAQALGLEVTPLSAFAIRAPLQPALILGFASCSPSELRRGVDVLAAALR